MNTGFDETPRQRTLAIDYDDTYSAAPDMWDKVIAIVKAEGHRVICVTCRRDTKENYEECNIPGVLTYFTSLGSKIWHMKNLGIEVDWWLDDNPNAVVNGH